jgi:hypothetical protein
MAFDAKLFGNAYDVTKKACSIGKLVFDFSLTLGRLELIQRILYAECKYRSEKTGQINADFKEFLTRVYQALSEAEEDDASSAIFLFLTNIPPDEWRAYLRDKRAFCSKQLKWEPGHPEPQILDRLVDTTHVLVVNANIVEQGE